MNAHRKIIAGATAAAIPAAHWEEAALLMAHPDARTHLLEIEYDPMGIYGARIFPPERQHLRALSPLSGSFYGAAPTPRAAVNEAVAKWDASRASASRWAAANKDILV